jgi:hypothetical protein
MISPPNPSRQKPNRAIASDAVHLPLGRIALFVEVLRSIRMRDPAYVAVDPPYGRLPTKGSLRLDGIR